jgi:hypothetical protein
VEDKTRKAPQAGRPAGIGQARIKKVAGQPPKQVLEPDPEHRPAAGLAYDGGSTPAKTDHALADLVWKYFSEEITQAVIELQQALTPETKGSSQQAGFRKG